MDRAAYIALSKFLALQGGLYHDFFQMKRYLLNQVDVKVKLYGSSPSFSLLSDVLTPDFKIDIVDVCLIAQKIRVNPAVIYAHSEMLTKQMPNIHLLVQTAVSRVFLRAIRHFTGTIYFKVKNLIEW